MEGREYVASHPGGIRPEPVRYFRYHPWPGLKYALGFAVFATLTLAVLALQLLIMRSRGASASVQFTSLIPFATLAGVFLIRLLRHWAAVKRHYQIGCVNPAIVVSEAPVMIAVYTDLARSGDDDYAFPVIKVLPARLGRAGDPKPKVGDRLVTVSLYGGRADDTPYWTDFDPWPATHATSDRAALQSAADALGDEEWAQLLQGLDRLPTPYAPGIHPLPAPTLARAYAPSDN